MPLPLVPTRFDLGSPRLSQAEQFLRQLMQGFPDMFADQQDWTEGQKLFRQALVKVKVPRAADARLVVERNHRGATLKYDVSDRGRDPIPMLFIEPKMYDPITVLHGAAAALIGAGNETGRPRGTAEAARFTKAYEELLVDWQTWLAPDFAKFDVADTLQPVGGQPSLQAALALR